MSESVQFPMSSEDLNSNPIEMFVNEEMGPEADELAEEFVVPDIRPTETPCIFDDTKVDIEYEDPGYHNGTSASDSETDNAQDFEIELNIPHIDCSSIRTEEKDMDDCYVDLLRCDRNCDTCQKYMRLLSEHVRAAHALPQPIQDPLLIDPLDIGPDPNEAQQSSSIQIKTEVEEDIERNEWTVEDPNSDSDSDPEPDLELERGSEMDPDYRPSPPTHLTQKPRRQRVTVPKDASRRKRKSNENKTAGQNTYRRVNNTQKQFVNPDKNNDKGKQSIQKKNKSLPIKHRLTSSKGPQKCDECEKSFSWNYELTTHKRIHSGEKPFHCVECEKSFANSKQLTSHMKNHTGEKPHVCEVCGTRFSQKSNFTTHMKNHTGDKPYKCTMCVKSFTNLSLLTGHIKVHTGERPFKCDECGKEFSQKGNLNKHKISHTRKKNVQV